MFKKTIAILILLLCLPAPVFGVTKVLEDGIWTWFNSPEADVDGSNVYFGAFTGTDTRRPVVVKHNLATGDELVTALLTPEASVEFDDHDNCAVKVLRSGKIFAAYAFHNGDSFCYTTTSPGDIRTFGSKVTVNTANDEAYAQILQADDTNDTLYWFYRVGAINPRPQHFRTSTDDGATWSAGTVFVEDQVSGRPYMRWFETSGNRFDFVFTNGHPAESTTSLFHGYIQIAANGTRTYHQTNGTAVTEGPPFDPGDFTTVYNGATNEAWIWDTRTYDSVPYCVFTVFPGNVHTAGHEYWRGSYATGSWVTEKICDAGTTAAADRLYAGNGDTYSGGVRMDPTNPDIVYVSREYGVGDFRIEKWTRTGGVWGKTTDISGATSSVNARPVTFDYNGATKLLYWGGTYTSFTDYATSVYLYPNPSLRSTKANTPYLDTQYTYPGAKLLLPMQEGTGTPADLYGTYTITTTGSLTWGAGSMGSRLTGFTTANYLRMDALAQDWMSATPRWCAVLFDNTDTTLTQYLVSVGSSSSVTPFAGLLINNGVAGTVTYFARGNTGSLSTASGAGTACNDGNLHVAMFSTVAANNHNLYFDGVRVGLSGTTITAATVNQMTVGNLRRDTIASPFLGNIYTVVWGYGSMPPPKEVYRDMISGRFTGQGSREVGRGHPLRSPLVR